MGDCRIRIVISTPDEHSSSSSSSATFYSSDTTVREVIEGHIDLWKLLSSANNEDGNDYGEESFGMTLWDCTLNPPKDITSWPFVDYPDLQGPKSLTLHGAGWFPSGTLVCLPKGISPTGYNNTTSNSDPYTDIQYNKTQKIHAGDDRVGSVQFIDQRLGPASKPSEVMASVSRRLVDEDEALNARRKAGKRNNEGSGSRQRQQYLERLTRQHERAKKLDTKISALEQKEDDKARKSKDGVSRQVLRMLVKSRASGDDRLKLQDRLYFQCLLLYPDVDSSATGYGKTDGSCSSSLTSSISKEYRYFSPQDTFGRIAGSFELDMVKIPKSLHRSSFLTEVLCRNPSSNSRYRRFPMSMRIYEAVSRGFLIGDIDTLIVRWYKDLDDATTTTVNDIDDDVNIVTNGNDGMELNCTEKDAQVSNQYQPSPDVPMIDSASSHQCGDSTGTDSFIDHKLAEAIQGLDGTEKKGSTKKAKSSSSSTGAMKVRQMKMKSKAGGDVKRIKIDDRVFLDVVTVNKDDGGNYCASSAYYFLSRKDPVERILQYIDKGKLQATSIIDWDLLVLNDNEEGKFKRILDTSKTMIELEDDGNINLKSFDRLILKSRK